MTKRRKREKFSRIFDFITLLGGNLCKKGLKSQKQEASQSSIEREKQWFHYSQNGSNFIQSRQSAKVSSAKSLKSAYRKNQFPPKFFLKIKCKLTCFIKGDMGNGCLGDGCYGSFVCCDRG